MEKIPKKSYKPREVAEMLGCSLDNVYRLIKEGKLQAFRIGGRVNMRITDIALQNFLDSEKVEAEQ